MSLQANELRLGNWIESYMVMSSGAYYDPQGNKHGEDIITTPKIRQVQVTIGILKLIDQNQALATYRGIPLTPEILSDLNFEDCMNHPRSPHFHLHNPWMILYKEPVKELVCRLGKHKDCFIRYVHQLQNIYFFLFGKELEYSPNIK